MVTGMTGVICCMVACFLVGVVCTWAWYEYSDMRGATLAVWVWETICLAVTLWIFFPR